MTTISSKLYIGKCYYYIVRIHLVYFKLEIWAFGRLHMGFTKPLSALEIELQDCGTHGISISWIETVNNFHLQCITNATC